MSDAKPALPVPDVKNAPYGPHARNVLDLWLAKSDKPTPLLVYIHGGGFRNGDKTDGYPEQVTEALAAGISVGALNYRLTTTAPYPAPMHDSARAIQFFRLNAARWNLDPERIAATGVSAGAGISLWLCFHDDLANLKSADPLERQSTRVQAALAISAQCTYDPRTIEKIIPGPAYDCGALKPLFGVPMDWDWKTASIGPELDALLKDGSPISHLRKDSGPVYVLHFASMNVDGNIHHANFGKHLKDEMDKLGIECIRRMDTDYKPAEGKTWVRESTEFLKKVFKLNG